MTLRDVPAAAAELGVSQERVRALIHDGQMEAQRIGGRWLVDAGEIARHAARQRRAGRPFGAERAWGLLALASDREPFWLSERDRRRLAEVLRTRGLDRLLGQLRRRARVERWYVHPAFVDDVLADPSVVVGGARATAELRDDRGSPDVYVRPRDAARLRDEYSPDVGDGRANVVVRVVEGAWPFSPGERRAWPAVAAADLLDEHPDDPRCRDVAKRLLAAADA